MELVTLNTIFSVVTIFTLHVEVMSTSTLLSTNATPLDSILKYVGVIRLFFLIEDLYSIGGWYVEDQRTNIIKTYLYKRLDYIFKIY